MLSSRNALGLHLEKNVCRNQLVKPARAPANRKPTTAATRPPPAEEQKPNQVPAKPPPPAKKSERDPSAKKPKQVDTRKGGDRHRCLCGSTVCARLSSKLARLCDRVDPWVGMASICCQMDSYRYYLLKEAIVRHLMPNVDIMCNPDTDNIDRMHIAKHHFSRHLLEYRQRAKIHWTTGLTGGEAVKLLHKKEDADSFDDGDGNVKWLQVPDNPLSDVIDHIALLEKAARAKEDRGKLHHKSKKELIQLLIGARQENESLSKELEALRIRKLIDDKMIRDLEGRIKRRMVKPEASVKGRRRPPNRDLFRRRHCIMTLPTLRANQRVANQNCRVSRYAWEA